MSNAKFINACINACADWGILPTAFNQCMTWEEQVLWITRFLQQEVIPTVNENTEEFNTLKTYVEEYFNNLDVQEEINNKLDEMAESGQLQDLIEAYFSEVDAKIDAQNAEITSFENITDGKVEAQNNTINDFKNEVNTTVSSQNGKITTLETRMDSFTNLEEGSTTGDAELIDGRISFDGKTFTNIGGNIRNYQGVGYEDITSSTTVVDGKYRNLVNSDATSALYEVYKLQTEKGKSYFVDCKTNGSSVAQVVFSRNHTIPASTGSVPSITNEDHEAPIIFKGTGGIAYINNLKANTSIFIGESTDAGNPDELAKYFIDITSSIASTVVTGKYRNLSGNEATNVNYKYYELAEPTVGKMYRIFTAIGTNVPACVNTGASIVFPANAADYELYNQPAFFDVMCTSSNPMFFNFMIPNMGDSAFKVYESRQNYLLSTGTSIDNVEPSVGAFSKAVFIGDSLTYGQTYVGGTQSSYHNYYNYPYYAKKLMDIDTITNLGKSGATSTSWLADFGDQIVDDNAIYFVWLGTNDTFTDTVDTDCAGDDWTQFSDTETGNFGKILGKISARTNVKIVMINTFTPSAKVDTNNKVISDLATKYGALLVDVNNAVVKSSGYHTAYNGHYNATHFNNQGYNLIANLVKERIDDYMNGHTGSFELYKVQA